MEGKHDPAQPCPETCTCLFSLGSWLVRTQPLIQLGLWTAETLARSLHTGTSE